MEAENRSSDVVAAAVELPSVNECQPMEDSQLGGVLVTGSMNSGASGLLEAPAPVNVVAVKAEVGVAATSDGKRKRGRPPKGQGKPMAPKKRKEEDEEEDVCFICFDGGSLVLCDRRGCPKAYHPACIKRDEAFFRSKAKWNCGWHICSSCQKAAHYMCYTCTYSLCKACTRYADYVCVRENKGFCRTCMRTIMLIENNGQGDKEMVQVDFDDKSSWEYLFKVYWVLLKGNLCLTLDELTQAQNPWKAAGSVPSKVKSLDVHYGGNDGKASIPDNTSGHLEANHSERTKDQLNLPKKADSPSTDRSTSDNNSISVGTKEWASKELLEFVAHMRNGNTSILSQFDLQTLLLDYIKINNLRDPRQKSHIICDWRLRNLFGKTRVGHFEMLKLLEFHCLMKEDSRNDVIQGNIVHAVTSQVEGDGNNDNLLMPGKHKYNTRRKGNERGMQPNLDDYAAIDIHNIKLMFLRRDLMESLIVDNGKFHDKVVGSFVRIRILNGDQNQDMYRLVEVVDTCKVAVPYKIGERTADFMLEILNLDKKERISIDAVSNQEFSEDECQQLRQSIKCGLVKRLTVGQVLEKATSLQEVRLNDKLETEIMRLSHLRDRASEKGHKKELRECVEKLELLKTPEERQRRLREIPEVHADPNMNPNCQSDKYPGVNSNKEQDGHVKSGYSGFGRDGREPYSSRNDDSSYHLGSGAWKELTTCDQRRSISSTLFLDKGASSGVVERKNESLWNEGKDACGSNTSEKPGNQVESSGSVVGGWNNQAGLSGPFSGVGSEASAASLSTGSALPAYDSETERFWQYRDPNGKIQGPFCMVQLRKWNTTGYFPTEMRIWNINDEENDSLLLTDLLNGQAHQVMPMQGVSLPFQVVKGASDSGLYNCDGGRWSGSMNATGIDGKLSKGGWNGSEAVAHSNANNEFINGDGWGSHSSSQTRPVDVQTGSSSQCSDTLNVKNSENPQVCCPAPSFTFTDQSRETSLHQASGREGQKCNSSPNHGNMIHQTTGGESWGSRPVNYSSNNWNSNSCFASVVNSTETLEKIFGIDINLPSPPPKTSDGDVEDQTTKDQQSVPSDKCVPDLNAQNVPSSTSKPIDGEEKADSSIQNMPSPLPKPADEDEKVVASENKQFVSNFPVQDSGPGWSSASRLVMGGGAQLPEMADKWGGYSAARAKPSFEEWDSGFVSSLKPPEVASDRAATPTSKCDELTTPSPPHHSSSWLASVTETIEISTLAEESVSDLLAEVDAMESQGGGLASPTSVNGGEELFHDSKTDCFTSLRGFVPPLDLGRSDASSSTVDVKLPTQPIATAEQIGAPSASRRSGEKSYKSTKMEVDTKPTEPSTISRNTIDTDPAPRARVKPIDTGVGAMQGNTNSGSREGLTQGNTNTGRGTSQGTPRGNSSTNRGTSAGFTGRESHPKHGGERLVSPRDRPLQGRDSGVDRGRSSWSRQSPFGSGGGGSGGNHARPPARGQRVCKFYESGHCKKGAFCNYLHPR